MILKKQDQYHFFGVSPVFYLQLKANELKCKRIFKMVDDLFTIC